MSTFGMRRRLARLLIGAAVILFTAAAGKIVGVPVPTPAPNPVSNAAHESAAVAVPLVTNTNGATPDTSLKSLLTLITEPADGIAPVLSLITNAKKSIDLVMYDLEDIQVEDALIAAKTRGVAVRVLLNKGYYGAAPKANAAAYTYLAAHDVSVAWTSPTFALTHQKTLVVDGTQALIMTFNLNAKYYKTGRDFGVLDTDATDVQAIEDTFTSDWTGQTTTASSGNDLVWSPNSETTLVNFIGTATSSLFIYNEEMADSKITNALVDAAGRGVKVEIVMTYSSQWKKAFQKLAGAGVEIRTYKDSTKAPLYIHAKVIIADSRKAFLGSENFSAGSLLKNRELGIMVDDVKVISSLTDTFQEDFAGGTVFDL